eukprot:TRINITY_DN16177_c0_g1_i1.p1 TRINITY_DN16177_c0_g1~~TRINITY_DN16177_c0_g1_i1.p1  ORF type:complete len:255 (-),score=30.82 TRINITY_DN16177_c0_g1_i1:566-1330(-)
MQSNVAPRRPPLKRESGLLLEPACDEVMASRERCQSDFGSGSKLWIKEDVWQSKPHAPFIRQNAVRGSLEHKARQAHLLNATHASQQLVQQQEDEMTDSEPVPAAALEGGEGVGSKRHWEVDEGQAPLSGTHVTSPPIHANTRQKLFYDQDAMLARRDAQQHQQHSDTSCSNSSSSGCCSTMPAQQAPPEEPPLVPRRRGSGSGIWGPLGGERRWEGCAPACGIIFSHVTWPLEDGSAAAPLVQHSTAMELDDL